MSKIDGDDVENILKSANELKGVIKCINDLSIYGDNICEIRLNFGIYSGMKERILTIDSARIARMVKEPLLDALNKRLTELQAIIRENIK